ncbi:MAG TPA: PEP-CTERM sorting domain-containing protein [Nitrospiraceae bacterium]|nr:PEP-CTERM sorting domain-containing protein [Nitrospiraceae bacterium]
MREVLLRLGVMAVIVVLSVGEPAGSSASTIQINPASLGSSKASFNADSIDFSYQLRIDQVAPAGTCSVVIPCTFTGSGGLSFSTFRSGVSNTPIPASTSGLNMSPGGYTVFGDFTGTGTAVPFTDANGDPALRATFNTFRVLLIGQGTSSNIIIRVASGSLVSGEAHVLMPLSAQAKGDFNILTNFGALIPCFRCEPFFGSLPPTATFAGGITDVTGVTFGTFSGATIQGSGTLSFTNAVPSAVPEPSSLLLLSSGLAGLGWFFHRRR